MKLLREGQNNQYWFTFGFIGQILGINLMNIKHINLKTD